MTVIGLAAMDGKGKCGIFHIALPSGESGKEAEALARATVLENIIHKPAVILAVIEELKV